MVKLVKPDDAEKAQLVIQNKVIDASINVS